MKRNSSSSNKTTSAAGGTPTWWIFLPGFLLDCCSVYLVTARGWLVAGGIIGLMGASLISLSVWHSAKRRMQ